ncbi:uncharacterized protein FFNC_15558 [Fusarium fujikuroi]|nr:uncharacterized protein FFNC_15558 [Fusarium fujikuroi]
MTSCGDPGINIRNCNLCWPHTANRVSVQMPPSGGIRVRTIPPSPQSRVETRLSGARHRALKHDREVEGRREEEPPAFTQSLLYDVYFCHSDEIYEEATKILLALQKSTHRGNPKWEEAVAIALAAQCRYTEAAGYFVKLDLQNDETKKNMVLAAARFGCSSELGEQPRTSVRELMNKSFIGMAGRGDLRGMKHIHDHGVSLDITSEGFTAVRMAAMSGDVHILEFLLEHGVNILLTSSDDSPLSTASHYGQKEVVEFFLEHRSEVTTTSDFLSPPFQHAVECWGYIDILRLIARHEPMFNKALATDGSLRLTLVLDSLHIDTKQRIELLKYFIQEVHMNINELDKNGRSVLHYAMGHGNVPLVREMMQLNADPHALDITGQSPLGFAANNDRTPDGEALIQWLSERPEEIPCRSIQKMATAIHSLPACCSTHQRHFK